MNRRDLFRSAGVVAASPVLMLAPAHTKAFALPAASLPIPKTVEQLKEAIELIFPSKVPGYVADRAWIEVGDQQIKFVTYVSSWLPENCERRDYVGWDLDSYWPTAEDAVVALWRNMVAMRDDPVRLKSKEWHEDYPGVVIQPATNVIWRAYPKVEKTQSGIHMVRMRAAFI